MESILLFINKNGSKYNKISRDLFNTQFEKIKDKIIDNFNYRDSFGNTLLHLSTRVHNFYMIEKLLELNPKFINVQNKDLETVLHMICKDNLRLIDENNFALTDQNIIDVLNNHEKNRKKIISEILKYNIDINIEDNNGLTAFDYEIGMLEETFDLVIVKEDKLKIFEMLLEKKPNFKLYLNDLIGEENKTEHVNNRQYRNFQINKEKTISQIFKMLLEYLKPNIDFQEILTRKNQNFERFPGLDPLMYSININISDYITNVLLEYNVNINSFVNIKKHEHITPLFLACYKNKQKIVEKLLEKGANINYGIEDNKHVLKYLITTQKISLIKLLFKTSPDVIIINDFEELSKIEDVEIRKYINFYKKKIKEQASNILNLIKNKKVFYKWQKICSNFQDNSKEKLIKLAYYQDLYKVFYDTYDTDKNTRKRKKDNIDNNIYESESKIEKYISILSNKYIPEFHDYIINAFKINKNYNETNMKKVKIIMNFIKIEERIALKEEIELLECYFFQDTCSINVNTKEEFLFYKKYINLLTKREICVLFAKKWEQETKQSIKCNNTTSILGDSIESIPFPLLINIKEENQSFCFNIMELKELIDKSLNENKTPINPFTRNPIDVKYVKDKYFLLTQILLKDKLLLTNVIEEIINNPIMSKASIYRLKVVNIFSKLYYPNDIEYFFKFSDKDFDILFLHLKRFPTIGITKFDDDKFQKTENKKQVFIDILSKSFEKQENINEKIIYFERLYNSYIEYLESPQENIFSGVFDYSDSESDYYTDLSYYSDTDTDITDDQSFFNTRMTRPTRPPPGFERRES